MSTALTAASWPSRAACRGRDTERWFPVGTADPDPYARATCLACEVRIDCLEWALANPKLASCGMWGGKSEEERRLERRRRNRAGVAA